MRIFKYQWDRMSDESVIDFWKSHNYSKAYDNMGKVPGWGFPSIESLNNFYNCLEQMKERDLL